jgi:hypothetical protein
VAWYSVTSNKAGVNIANTIMWTLRADATQRIWLVELGVSVEVAPTTGPAWRLNRVTATGTITTSIVPQPEDPDVPAALTRLDTVWSVNPTLGGVDLRRYATPSTIGSGIVWTWFDEPFVIPKSGGVAVVNANPSGATVGSMSVYARVRE